MQQPYIGAQGIQCPCETPFKCFGVHHALADRQAVVPVGSNEFGHPMEQLPIGIQGDPMPV